MPQLDNLTSSIRPTGTQYTKQTRALLTEYELLAHKFGNLAIREIYAHFLLINSVPKMFESCVFMFMFMFNHIYMKCSNG